MSTTTTTNIDSVSNSEIIDTEIDTLDFENLTINQFTEYSVDFTISDDLRKAVIEMFCKYYETHALESLNRLAHMYMFSRVKSIERFIYELCVNSSLTMTNKILLANSLCSSGEEVGYDAMNILCNLFNEKSSSTVGKQEEPLATPLKIEAIIVLMESYKYKEESLKYFVQIINNTAIDCNYRYKTILGLEYRQELKNQKFFLCESMKCFFFCSENLTRYRILSAQYLRQKCDLGIEDIECIEGIVLNSFALDPSLDFNVRADAADMLIRLGLPENVTRARLIIRELGNPTGGRSVYDNAQNVHVVEIEKSAIDAIEYMINTQPAEEVKRTHVAAIKKEIDDFFKDETNKKQISDKQLNPKDIDFALNRIVIDRALYSKYNCTLESVLIRVWVEIQKHAEHREEMFLRLLEELVEMSGTCSTGYITRMINVFSGFGLDFGIRISLEDQFIANFQTKFQKYLQNMPEEIKPEIARFLVSEMFNPRNLPSMLFFDGMYDDKEIHKKYSFLHRQVSENSAAISELLTDFYENVASFKDCLVEFQFQTMEDISNTHVRAHNRKFFNFFIIKIYSYISNDLYEEFKDYISKEEFSFYMQRALLHYQEELN